MTFGNAHIACPVGYLIHHSIGARLLVERQQVVKILFRARQRALVIIIRCNGPDLDSHVRRIVCRCIGDVAVAVVSNALQSRLAIGRAAVKPDHPVARQTDERRCIVMVAPNGRFFVAIVGVFKIFFIARAGRFLFSVVAIRYRRVRRFPCVSAIVIAHGVFFIEVLRVIRGARRFISVLIADAHLFAVVRARFLHLRPLFIGNVFLQLAEASGNAHIFGNDNFCDGTFAVIVAFPCVKAPPLPRFGGQQDGLSTLKSIPRRRINNDARLLGRRRGYL